MYGVSAFRRTSGSPAKAGHYVLHGSEKGSLDLLDRLPELTLVGDIRENELAFVKRERLRPLTAVCPIDAQRRAPIAPAAPCDGCFVGRRHDPSLGGTVGAQHQVLIARTFKHDRGTAPVSDQGGATSWSGGLSRGGLSRGHLGGFGHARGGPSAPSCGQSRASCSMSGKRPAGHVLPDVSSAPRTSCGFIPWRAQRIFPERRQVAAASPQTARSRR
jgi:hypothetical protein